jgi:hypothetical protein
MMSHIVKAAGPWEYFTRKVRIGRPDTCWEWMGSCGTPGYGNWGFHGMQAAHRATYKLFNGEPVGLVLHRCGNRKCCNPDHLYDGTYKDNRRDSELHGTAPLGNRHGQARLTEEQVIEIRAALRRGERRKDIALRYQVSPTTVTHIKTGACWGWLQA